MPPTSCSGAACAWGGRPLTVTEPLVGSSRPRIMRIVVDFPAPFGPRKPVTVPGRTVNVRSETAVVGPYRLVSSWISIMTTTVPNGRLPVIGAPSLPRLGKTPPVRQERPIVAGRKPLYRDPYDGPDLARDSERPGRPARRAGRRRAARRAHRDLGGDPVHPGDRRGRLGARRRVCRDSAADHGADPVAGAWAQRHATIPAPRDTGGGDPRARSAPRAHVAPARLPPAGGPRRPGRGPAGDPVPGRAVAGAVVHRDR